MTVSHPIAAGEVIRIPALKGDPEMHDPELDNRPAVILGCLPRVGDPVRYYVSPGSTGYGATPPPGPHVVPDPAGRFGLRKLGVYLPIYFRQKYLTAISFHDVVAHLGTCPDTLLRALRDQAGFR